MSNDSTFGTLIYDIPLVDTSKIPEFIKLIEKNKKITLNIEKNTLNDAYKIMMGEEESQLLDIEFMKDIDRFQNSTLDPRFVKQLKSIVRRRAL